MSDGELVRVFNELHYSNGGEPMFDKYNGISIVAVGDGWAEGELEVSRHSLNPHGIVHGGALVALADTVAGCAAFTSGQICVTLDCSMQYLAPGTGSYIHCLATPKKLGKTILVYDAVLTNDQGQTVATGTYTFVVTEMRVEDAPF